MLNRIMRLLLVACLLLPAPELAEESARPPIILMFCYQQMGWGVRANAVFLDEAGGIWRYENEAGLPRETIERLELLQTTADAERVGQLDAQRVKELQSLIAAIQPEEIRRSSGSILDYGLDTYSAIRYGEDGAAEILCLAQWGDWMYEHTDENARAVYLALFTEVMGKELNSEEYTLMYQPTPFERMPLAAFCGVEKDSFAGATVTLRENGAERTLKGAEAKKALAWLQSLAVTGKRSALTDESSKTVYLLTKPDGTTAAYAFCGDLLATPDGMYTVEALTKSEIKKLEASQKMRDAIDEMKENKP